MHHETDQQLTIDPTLIEAMNRWRLMQNPVPTPNEAIMMLIKLGLETGLPPERPPFNAAEQAWSKAFRDALRK